MQYKANSSEEYITQIPEERQRVMQKLRETIQENLPDGFEESMSYGMIGYVVPHSLYPDGYHCVPKQPLPFISIASQKNFIALYHLGLYADQTLMDWFVSEYPKHNKTKLDMGKSCIRFKKIEQLPFVLIAELVSKLTVQKWIDIYEKNVKR